MKRLEEYTNRLYENPCEFEDIESEGQVIISKEEQWTFTQRIYLPSVGNEAEKDRNRVLYLIKQQGI